MQKVDGGHSLTAKGCDTDERGETVTSQPKRDECTRHTTLKMRRHKHAILSGRNEPESSDGGGGGCCTHSLVEHATSQRRDHATVFSPTLLLL